MSEPMNAWVPPDRPATTDDGRAGPTAATTPGLPVPGP
jgi:hypothetical protein